MDYETLELSLNELLLDTDNPRLGSLASQSEALQAIINLNYNHFRTMMLSIKDHGLDPGDTLYVIESNENCDYTVLEGNRRLSAIKVLANPDLLQATNIDDSHKKVLARAAMGFSTEMVEPIRCTLFPDRETANPWIQRRHTGQNEGEGRVPWGHAEQRRFEKDHSILDIIDFVGRSGLIEEKDWSTTREAIENRRFTTLARILESKPGRDHLGLRFQSVAKDKQAYLKTKPAWAAKVLLKIVTDLREDLINSRDTNSASDIKAYLSTFPKSLQPSLAQAAAEKAVRDISFRKKKAQPTKPLVTTKKTGKQQAIPKPRRQLSPRKNAFAHPEAEKGKLLLLEAAKLNADTYPVSASFLLRAFLELSLEKYMDDNGIQRWELKKNGSTEKLSLSACADRSLKQMKAGKQISASDERVFKNAVLNGKSETSIQALNDFVHHKFAIPNGKALRQAWDACTPLFIAVYGKQS